MSPRISCFTSPQQIVVAYCGGAGEGGGGGGYTLLMLCLYTKGSVVFFKKDLGRQIEKGKI